MYESTEGQVPGPSAGAQAVGSPVDTAFAALLDELFSGPRVTYAPVRESPTYYGGHTHGQRRHRRFVLRAGTDLDDPR
ncbi:hypothetical protein [Promicromonospora iranensis]|uniref:Uncharacterized protein n=1 Tax=Promicromonospora iranensis TaxID=1105144 RepID=A0ABU2CWQ2_9MICO|nr:hypothetical protein [Promicromonospora iranensis]MDR7385775.1 hypothetical protein [Promicromonospora iranensis]